MKAAMEGKWGVSSLPQFPLELWEGVGLTYATRDRGAGIHRHGKGTTFFSWLGLQGDEEGASHLFLLHKAEATIAPPQTLLRSFGGQRLVTLAGMQMASVGH